MKEKCCGKPLGIHDELCSTQTKNGERVFDSSTPMTKPRKRKDLTEWLNLIEIANNQTVGKPLEKSPFLAVSYVQERVPILVELARLAVSQNEALKYQLFWEKPYEERLKIFKEEVGAEEKYCKVQPSFILKQALSRFKAIEKEILV
jgi:hypothetical protein